MRKMKRLSLKRKILEIVSSHKHKCAYLKMSKIPQMNLFQSFALLVVFIKRLWVKNQIINQEIQLEKHHKIEINVWGIKIQQNQINLLIIQGLDFRRIPDVNWTKKLFRNNRLAKNKNKKQKLMKIQLQGVKVLENHSF